MSNTAIKVENLSKQYRLGQVGTGTLSHDLNRWWHRVRGKEDPYLKIGESNDRSTVGNSEYVWALKDINFEVKQGEVLGIIGKNGAGKSTLLKILSKVTGPTTGSIKAKGRIASLLEVGTGFHPELTGRENIYLNGTILGMTKAEVSQKLDEIVDFAGIERYLDTPVKRYSSGMKVRLGFAVAAHLEPEILIVDEVLAVGDVEFQKKAVGKIQDVSTEGGRTVLFVSHNMGSVKSLCSRCMVLADGQVSFVGDTQGAVTAYLNQKRAGRFAKKRSFENVGKSLMLKEVSSTNEEGELKGTFYTADAIHVSIQVKVLEKIIGSRLVLQLVNQENVVVFASTNHHQSKTLVPGLYAFNCIIPGGFLKQGIYWLRINAGIPGVQVLFPPIDVLQLSVVADGTHGSNFPERWPGIVAPTLNWEITEIEHKTTI